MGTFLLNDNYTYKLLSKILTEKISPTFDMSNLDIYCAMRIDTVGDIRRFLAGISNLSEDVPVYFGALDGSYVTRSLPAVVDAIPSTLALSSKTPTSLADVMPYYMMYCRAHNNGKSYDCIVTLPMEDAKQIISD